MSKHDVFEEEEWGSPEPAGAYDDDEEFEQPRRGAPRWSGRAVLAAGLCLAGVVALGLTVFGAARDDSKAAAYPRLPEVVAPSAAPAATEQPQATEAREIVVSVVGAVRTPGLARLTPGSRVADALEAAGGLSAEAETSGLNLAQRLEDGDQVVVGAAATALTPAAPAPAAPRGAPPAPRPQRAPAKKAAPEANSRCECGGNRAPGAPNPGRAPTNVNTATEAELDAVPGIGKGIARAIVQYRASHGRIRSIDELAKIKQIGAGRLKKLRPHLRL